jgi:hypothetical protein
MKKNVYGLSQKYGGGSKINNHGWYEEGITSLEASDEKCHTQSLAFHFHSIFMQILFPAMKINNFQSFRCSHSQ